MLRVFNQLFYLLPKISDDFEIIIVNDGSTDETARECEQLLYVHSFVKLITHSKNMGIGMALRSGYSAASKEYVCAVPGDGQFNVDELRQVKPFPLNIYYSFYRPQTHYSIYRMCLTWGNRLFNQHILAVYLRDVNWIKVYRREHIAMANPQLHSSLIESEICAKLYKSEIMPIEIPSDYLPRNSGKSKGGGIKTLRMALRETLKLWWVVFKYKSAK